MPGVPCAPSTAFGGPPPPLRRGEDIALMPSAGLDPPPFTGGGDRRRRWKGTLTPTSASPITALVLGSGFERLPDLVDELANHFPLAGNSGETIRRVKDPEPGSLPIAPRLRHPSSRHNPGRETRRCGQLDLRRQQAALAECTSGPVKQQRQQRNGPLFQRFVRGARACPRCFVADRDSAHVVGFSRQWTSPTPGSPYRYGGAVLLRRLYGIGTQ